MPAATFAAPQIELERRSDGTAVMRSTVTLPTAPTSLGHAFARHAAQSPGRLLVAERSDTGWSRTTWGEAARVVARLAQGLIDRDLAGAPVLILSGNSTGHLLLTLAALTVGAPVVPTSVAYSLQSADHAKLRTMAELVRPGTIFAADETFSTAAAAAAAATGPDAVLVSTDGQLPGSIPLSALEAEPTEAVAVHLDRLGPDSVAKILFTSGSTGTPKGVLNTHGMLSANQEQIRAVWPFLIEEPPVLLDWLPWSHTFGGNHNLNMVLTNGGTLWIDDGRPLPALIGRTVANLADVSPTIYFNVPAGYAALVPLLERDDDAARRFLARLRLGFFAAAALPQQLWDRLGKLAAQHGSAMTMTTAWGLTETAPGATTTHYLVLRSDCMGVPLPGVELKLVPTGDKTEVRVRGPNVTAGYHQRPDLSAEAFDDEGFLRTGDAVELTDPDHPAQGITFRGRIAEDFKLATGTFVSVGMLRPALLSAADGLLTDAVICGQDGAYVAALVWLHPDHVARAPDGQPDDGLRADLAAMLDRLADSGGGSSQRVERVLVLREPPALDAGEITDKGYVNQRAVRDRRSALVSELLADPVGPAVVVRSVRTHQP